MPRKKKEYEKIDGRLYANAGGQFFPIRKKGTRLKNFRYRGRSISTKKYPIDYADRSNFYNFKIRTIDVSLEIGFQAKNAKDAKKYLKRYLDEESYKWLKFKR